MVQRGKPCPERSRIPWVALPALACGRKGKLGCNQALKSKAVLWCLVTSASFTRGGCRWEGEVGKGWGALLRRASPPAFLPAVGRVYKQLSYNYLRLVSSEPELLAAMGTAVGLVGSELPRADTHRPGGLCRAAGEEGVTPGLLLLQHGCGDPEEDTEPAWKEKFSWRGLEAAG